MDGLDYAIFLTPKSVKLQRECHTYGIKWKTSLRMAFHVKTLSKAHIGLKYTDKK